jgi:hypothetical protein
MSLNLGSRFGQGVTAVTFGAMTLSGLAQVTPVPTPLSNDYLLIGMGPENNLGGRPGVGQAVNINNFEIGANKAPVPSSSSFLVGGGSSGGPGLLGNVPNIPLAARPLFSGVCYDGNVAVTSLGGVFNFQDVGVYADLGIRVARSAAAADVGTSNSFYNDPFFFPNTFTPTGFTNPGVNNNTGGFGTDVNPNAANQNTRIDAPLRTGVVGNYNFGPLMAELAANRAAINALAQTSVLDLRSTGGQIQSQTRVLTLTPGLNVIDVLTNGNDFLLNNASLIIDGPLGSAAIIRIPDNSKFLISNGNVLVGNGGIGLESVLFYTDRPDNSGHFNFNNAVLNGVAFWSLGGSGGEIVINNAQGCTQFVADKINLNDVRFCRCAFGPPAPSVAIEIVGDVGCASGGTAEFTVVVQNNGDADLTNVVVLSSADAGCGRNLGDLAAGASVTYTCSIADVMASFTNEVCVSAAFGASSVSACDQAFVEVGSAVVDIRLQSEGPDVRTVLPGTDVEFEISVTNAGEVPLENLVITSSIPDCERTLGSLGVGQTITYTCTLYNVQQKTTVRSCASADACGVVVENCDKSFIYVGGCNSDCPADVNLDRLVNLTDLSILLGNYGLMGGAQLSDGDVNCDGDVDLADLASLVSQFGQECFE